MNTKRVAREGRRNLYKNARVAVLLSICKQCVSKQLNMHQTTLRINISQSEKESESPAPAFMCSFICHSNRCCVRKEKGTEIYKILAGFSLFLFTLMSVALFSPIE